MEIKFGKLPPVIDKRTIKFGKILNKKFLPDLPDSYDIDSELQVIDDRMFLNNQLGCCVISARAHQTLRFEKFEQRIQPDIKDGEVETEYFKETGGGDTGLVLLNSLKKWRNEGWLIGGKKYLIYAFASVGWKDHIQVKQCISLLGGVNFGMQVSQSAMDQFKAGEPWTVVANGGGNQGGHGVYAYRYGVAESYNQNGLWCMTWGKRQFMTWEFWDKYVDEAYGIVDNRDDWVGNSPVDVEKLDGYLREITAGNEKPCPLASFYAWAGNGLARLVGSKTRLTIGRIK